MTRNINCHGVHLRYVRSPLDKSVDFGVFKSLHIFMICAAASNAIILSNISAELVTSQKETAVVWGNIILSQSIVYSPGIQLTLTSVQVSEAVANNIIAQTFCMLYILLLLTAMSCTIIGGPTLYRMGVLVPRMLRPAEDAAALYETTSDSFRKLTTILADCVGKLLH